MMALKDVLMQNASKEEKALDQATLEARQNIRLRWETQGTSLHNLIKT
jgi:hypothetical protein